MPTVECPSCGEQFYVVYPEDDATGDQPENQDSAQNHDVSTLDANLREWKQLEPRHPYPAEAAWSEEQIKENIQRAQATIEINGRPKDFEFFYKPMDDFHFWTHVVRGETEGGRRSKNALWTEDGQLYMKNRGVPWNQDKRWTYLSEEELQRRSKMADLGAVIDLPETEGGLGLLLGIEKQPLVESGEVNEELLLRLAKALLVFQSNENPAR